MHLLVVLRLLARKGCGHEDDSGIEACRHGTDVAGADRCGAGMSLPGMCSDSQLAGLLSEQFRQPPRSKLGFR